MSDIVDKIQKAAVRRLNQMAQQVLDDTGPQIIDPIKDFKALSQQSNEFLMHFVTNLYNNFDELMGREVTERRQYGHRCRPPFFRRYQPGYPAL